jgi:hypothetical protein
LPAVILSHQKKNPIKKKNIKKKKKIHSDSFHAVFEGTNKFHFFFTVNESPLFETASLSHATTATFSWTIGSSGSVADETGQKYR